MPRSVKVAHRIRRRALSLKAHNNTDRRRARRRSDDQAGGTGAASAPVDYAEPPTPQRSRKGAQVTPTVFDGAAMATARLHPHRECRHRRFQADTISSARAACTPATISTEERRYRSLASRASPTTPTLGDRTATARSSSPRRKPTRTPARRRPEHPGHGDRPKIRAPGLFERSCWPPMRSCSTPASTPAGRSRQGQRADTGDAVTTRRLRALPMTSQTLRRQTYYVIRYDTHGRAARRRRRAAVYAIPSLPRYGKGLAVGIVQRSGLEARWGAERPPTWLASGPCQHRAGPHDAVVRVHDEAHSGAAAST